MTKFIFSGISEENKNHISGCLSSFTKKYGKDEIISDFASDTNISGYVKRGKCELQKINKNGDVSVIERYESGDIFGKTLSFINSSEDGLTVVSVQNCEVMFLDSRKLLSPCRNNCEFHRKLIDNVIDSILRRSERLTKRIDILTRKSIREKLLVYFGQLSKEQNSMKITIPISFTELAEYLAVNRSAMTREIKKLHGENAIEIVKRTVILKIKD